MKLTAKQLKIFGLVALVAGAAINVISGHISNERSSLETREAAGEAAVKAVDERISEIKGA